MKKFCFFAACGWLAMASSLMAQDWSQWRGVAGSAKASGFSAPADWPEKLTEVWKVEVGDGVATPALVGNRMYVFARLNDQEVLKCVDAETGKTIWEDAYAAQTITGAAGGFPGPRCTPAVANGKVVAIGVHGSVKCYDADSGKVIWKNDAYEGKVPRFNTSSSPVILGDVCIAQLGNEQSGGVFALNLKDGSEKWKWDGGGPSYASPAVGTFGEHQAIVAVTERTLVVLNAQDGKEIFKTEYQQGRYNAADPIVVDDTILVAGPNRGATGYKVSAEDGSLKTKESEWRNDETTVQFNTPLCRDGFMFGISNQNEVFCISLADAKTVWTSPLGAPAPGAASGRGNESGPAGRPGAGGQEDRGGQGGQGSGQGGGRRGSGGGRGRGGGGGGYGSLVDAGEALFALSPAGKLVVCRPSTSTFEKLAEYQVAEGGTYAYPVIAGEFVYIKDKNSLTKWKIK